jgi:hypothetical protein
MLAVVLAAGLSVGNGPERVSTEVVECLHLRGVWEGTWQIGLRQGKVIGTYEIRLEPGSFSVLLPGQVVKEQHRFACIDEEKGRCRLVFDGTGIMLGIYRREVNHWVISVDPSGNGRPATLRAGKGQALLVLRRVK